MVKIYDRKGKKGRAKLLKVYRFKETVPQVKKTIQVEHYDYGEWCVSERGWTEEKEVNVYDEEVINSIKERALKFYNKYLTTLNKK